MYQVNAMVELKLNLLTYEYEVLYSSRMKIDRFPETGLVFIASIEEKAFL